MTHTTTDAAEARAMEVLAKHVKTGSADLDFVLNGERDAVVAAMLAFATAEAASGAGEREESWTGDPHGLAAELRRVASGWGPGFRLPQLLRDAADEIDCLSTHASLPPATDPAIPDGCKLVPVEPTGEMVAAGVYAISDTDLDGPSVWSAMLAAAPTIPDTGTVYDGTIPATGHAATEGEGA